MVQVLAHRGVTAAARENTIAAFAAAAAARADGVELDVRATADGALVVVHDAGIAGLGAVAELDSGQLPRWIPTLAEALDACAGLALVNVEIKSDGAPPDLAERVASALVARAAGPELLVSSFDLSLLDAHRRFAPDIATGWLTLPGLPAPDLALAVETAAAGGHRAVNAHVWTITGELVGRAHRAGLHVGAWTVNDPERAIELARLGVDVLITDHPANLRVHLSGLSET
ncbi:MAG TPA: glycerophosphodiester phosphodiesterase [Acidimicrobiales bacterium]|nr:glycerophosphodiester phosphodiesterase [Acidimicrobiales bacterium]